MVWNTRWPWPGCLIPSSWSWSPWVCPGTAGRQGQADCSPALAQCLADSQNGNGVCELLSLPSPFLLPWYPTLLQTGHYSLSCVNIFHQVTMFSVTTLPISAPYNIDQFCRLALGGLFHFPSFPIPCSLGGHFPVAVKFLPSHSHSIVT